MHDARRENKETDELEFWMFEGTEISKVPEKKERCITKQLSNALDSTLGTTGLHGAPKDSMRLHVAP